MASLTPRSLQVVALVALLPIAALAEEWKIEDLGIPINAVNYENSGGVLAAGSGGQGAMFYTSYYRSTGAELVGYDFRTKRAFQRKIPSNGGYGLAVDAGGAVYAGGVNPGDLHRYDPKTDQLATINLKPFGVQYIWDAATAPDGTVYAAAGYPKTNLVAFDPRSGKPRDLGEVVPGQQYLRSVCIDRGGKVWCGVGMTAHLVVYDPADGSKTAVLPAEYAKSSSVYDLTAVGDFVLASVSFDGVVLVYDAATRKVVRTIPRPTGQKSWLLSAGGHDHTAYLYTLPSMDVYRCDLGDGSLTCLLEGFGQVKVVEADRWLHALNDQSYIAYDLQEKCQVGEHVLSAGGDGMDVFSLIAGPDGNVYGSTYINMHIFSCSELDGKLTDLGKVSRWAGQVDSMSCGRDGRIYLGAYTDAVLSVYDPRQPWRPGLKSDSNPREIGPIGKGQYRTRANCLGPDGRVYVGSIPSYRSAESGAFTICDPATGKKDVRLDFVKGGAVDCLIADDTLVYGSGGGEFFAYDPKVDRKVFSVQRPVTSLALVTTGVVAGSGGGKLFTYDRKTGELVERPNPSGDFTHMTASPDGTLYGVNAKQAVEVLPRGQVRTIAKPGGKFDVFVPPNRFYFARGPHLFRGTRLGSSTAPSSN